MYGLSKTIHNIWCPHTNTPVCMCTNGRRRYRTRKATNLHREKERERCWWLHGGALHKLAVVTSKHHAFLTILRFSVLLVKRRAVKIGSRYCCWSSRAVVGGRTREGTREEDDRILWISNFAGITNKTNLEYLDKIWREKTNKMQQLDVYY